LSRRKKTSPANQSPAESPEDFVEWAAGVEHRMARDIVLSDMRAAVDLVKVWEECGRQACSRAKRCRDAKVACFDEFAEAIQGTLRALADWERFDGDFDEAWYARLAARVRAVLDTGKVRP
jgi:hypothetical protein